MPTPIPNHSIAWLDVANGKTMPVTAAPVKLGRTLTLRVTADKRATPAMRMTITDAAGKVVLEKLDIYYPFRVTADDKGLSLPPGPYVFTAVPCAADSTAIGKSLSVAFVVAGDVTSKPPVVDGDPIPPVTPPVEQTPGSGPEWGACGNSGDGVGAVCEAITRIKADGGTVYRLWSTGYGKINDDTVAIIRFANAAGVKVILCCQPKRAPFGKPDFGQFAKVNASVLKLVWYVEAGNELNLSEYRPTDWSDHGWHQLYVDLWLRPLFVALRGIGVKTMCTSTTDTHHPENYAKHNAKLIAAGAKDCCDAVAIHVYTTPKFLSGVETLINDFCDQWDKPVHGTEMAPHAPTSNLSHYPPYLAACRRSKLASFEVYRGVPHSDPERWSARLSMFDAKGRPTDVYRMTLEAFA